MIKSVNYKIVAFIVCVATIVITLSLLTGERTQKAVRTIEKTVKAKSLSKDTTKVHDNSNKNYKLHIIYEIYAIDAWDAEFTLKFGISSQKDYITKEGNPRPQYQLKSIVKDTQFATYKIEYRILMRNIAGRMEAKAIEKKYVTEYYFSHHEQMPPLQVYPLPEDLF